MEELDEIVSINKSDLKNYLERLNRNLHNINLSLVLPPKFLTNEEKKPSFY
jgi:hypothetical protein